MSSLSFKEAESPCELRQIHALNHRVFAEEIAQHHTQPSGLLIDRFDRQNRYFIALRDQVVIGMISAHDGPDFSVARRLRDPEILRTFARPIEVRLLAIDPGQRNRTVLTGLLWQAYGFAVSHGYSHLLISGIAERESMYRKLGFAALGPAVPEGSASFIPMVMAIREQERNNSARVGLHERRWRRVAGTAEPVSLMPGPVRLSPSIARAFRSPAVSHRSPAFVDLFEDVRNRLQSLQPAMEPVLFSGAGTLANDAVAANLHAIFGRRKGLVLANGEFGERLARQAASAGLQFRTLEHAWGEPWSFGAIEEALNRQPAWLWAVHLETSTGVLNDADRLLELASAANCRVALDCVSSLGATPLPGKHVPLLSSSVSGKSLGSCAGLAFVFLSAESQQLLAGKVLCPSFDLLRMLRQRGPASTVHTPSVMALARALEENYATPEDALRHYRECLQLGSLTRRELRRAGIEPIAAEEHAAPNITSFALPDAALPQRCLAAGYEIAHESPYLRARQWGQIATMGHITPAVIEALFSAFDRPKAASAASQAAF